MAPGDIPIYFEGSWSILSTIGLINILFGLMIVGITGYSPIALVPIVVSIATAIANGLCYYALYQNHSTKATLIGGVFADFFWLIQEAGLSFYSYMILRRVLRARARVVFLVLFWLLITIISALRFGILVCRARDVVESNVELQFLVTRLHIGYFVSIAVVEILSAVFLLRIFAEAKKGSAEIMSKGGLFHYLTQSTELRLATLAVIGITRAVTYSFQKTQVASDVTGQIDRFVFTLECMYPMIMYIDILASRIATVKHSHASSSNNNPHGHATNPTSRSRSLFPNTQRSRHDNKDAVKMYAMSRSRSRVGPGSPASSSQEHIVGVEEMGVKSVVETMDGRRESRSAMSGRDGISKTVEVTFCEEVK